MSSRDTDDSGRNRLFTIAPWDGSKTQGFRKFLRDFKTGANALFLSEDDYSIWQACLDMDQGGNHVNADQLPGPNQAGYANAVRKRKKRQAKAFEKVYMHQDDERIKEMLDAIPMDDDRRGAKAHALIMTECGTGDTDLDILDTRQDFENSNIEKDIGYSDETDAVQSAYQTAQLI